MKNNPMQSAHAAPRCGARTRKGTPCRSPVVRGRARCRMHGGTNPGAPMGNKNAERHGYYSAQAKADRRAFRALLREVREQLEGAPW